MFKNDKLCYVQKVKGENLLQCNSNYKVKNLSLGIGQYIYLIISTFLLVKLNGILKDVGVLTVVIYGIIQVFPIIFIVRSLGNIKEVFNINNSIKLKVIIKKVILTIIFSIAIISTTLAMSGYSGIFKWNNLYIFNILWLILFALPEEIIFRGYFQGLMDKVIGNRIISIIITGLLFALIHIFNISGFLDSGLFIFFIKVSYYVSTHAFFNLVKEKTNSLVAPTIVHALFNFILQL